MVKGIKNICKALSSEPVIFAYFVCYLVVGIGTVSPFLCGRPYFDLYCNIVKAFGLIVLFAAIIHGKRIRFDWELVLLSLFIVSYLVSCPVSMEYGGIWNNLKGVFWIILQCWLMAGLIREGIRSKWLLRLLIVYIVITTVFACASVALSVIGFIYVPTLSGYDTLNFGSWSGRLYGVYKDPNYGAISSFLCIYALVFLVLLDKKRWKPVVACVLVLPQIYVIALSGSRTAQVSILASVIVLAFMLAVKYLPFKKQIIRWISSLAIGAVSCVLVFVIISAFGFVYEKVEPVFLQAQGGSISDTIQIYPRGLSNDVARLFNLGQISDESTTVALKGTDKDTSSQQATSFVSDETQQKIANSTPLQDSSQSEIAHAADTDTDHVGVLARDESHDLSNNRFALWASALKIWKTSPLIGVSHYNILNFVKAQFPDSRMAQMQQITAHNAYIDILAAQGIFGVVTFGGIIIVAGVYLIILSIRSKRNGLLWIIVTSCFVFILCTALFYPELVYINTIDSLVFWGIIGLARSGMKEEVSLKPILNKKAKRSK